MSERPSIRADFSDETALPSQDAFRDSFKRYILPCYRHRDIRQDSMCVKCQGFLHCCRQDVETQKSIASGSGEMGDHFSCCGRRQMASFILSGRLNGRMYLLKLSPKASCDGSAVSSLQSAPMEVLSLKFSYKHSAKKSNLQFSMSNTIK